MSDNILEIRNLKTHFFTNNGVVRAVDGITFGLRKGENLCLVGESGCGKTTVASSILRLIDNPPGRIVDGEILYHREDLLRCSDERIRQIRGNRIAMIFQDPQSALNPVLTVGDQIVEQIRLHLGLMPKQAVGKAVDLMEQAGIPQAGERIKDYPHQFSGGMQQRVLIAAALSCDPEILIADEPVTALDTTIKAQILDMFQEMKKERNMSTLFITHDLGTVAGIADRIVVMYGGRLAETGMALDIFDRPKHPYTIGLIKCLPVISTSRDRLTPITGTIPSLINPPEGCIFEPRCERRMSVCRRERPVELSVPNEHIVACHLYSQGGCKSYMSAKLIEVENLKKYYPVTAGLLSRHIADVKAVDRVTFHIMEGETLGLVGESGCGKSSLGRTLLRLEEPTAGRVCYQGSDIMTWDKKQLKVLRKKAQMIFQDPQSSLDPRMTTGDSIGEALLIHGMGNEKERLERVEELLRRVGLEPQHAMRYPHELSGGQKQRIGIARALAVNPKFIVADEPVSSLDVSVQAQILNLIMDLQCELNLAYLFIAHDLLVIGQVSDRIAVMYLGKIIELSDRMELFSNPLHPYTEALLSAVHPPDPHQVQKRIILHGEVPSPVEPPSGCNFHTRCPKRMAICSREEPVLLCRGSHLVFCHLYD
ncbi:dipeptide ABC transporter ATP-binding protein [Chloroflexota bacterium]